MKKFIFGIWLGALFGIFFAQNSGKKLREKLRKSKSPTGDFLREIFNCKKEAFEMFVEKLEKFAAEENSKK